MTPNEKPYLIAFTLIPGIGPATIERLLKYFGTASNAWHTKAKDLPPGILNDDLTNNFDSLRAAIDPAAEWEKVAQAGIQVVAKQDKAYPELLKEIAQAPALLYVRGNEAALQSMGIAVVGTRKLSAYGRLVTEKLTTELVRAGLTIVSGLAIGVDAVAHQSALDAGGATIAVLGSAVDQVYPKMNERLADAILAQGGALISEYPLGTLPAPHLFPMRNRIVSGMTLGTLVTEAGAKSGALITAQLANEQNREVFAVPGAITHQGSTGTNALIQTGAKLVTCIEDILLELNLEAKTDHLTARQTLPQDKEEAALYELLRVEPLSADALSRQLKQPVSAVNTLLTLMEMKGMIARADNGCYCVKS